MILCDNTASRKSRVRLAVPGQPVTTPRSEQLDGGSTSQIVTRPGNYCVCVTHCLLYYYFSLVTLEIICSRLS